VQMLSAAFEKTACVLSRRTAAREGPTGVEARPRNPRVGWDIDFMKLLPTCLSDRGKIHAKDA